MRSGRHRLGLVGCGRWGEVIQRDLLEIGCDVVVADPLEPRRSRALEHGASEAIADAADLPDVDGVVVAVPVTRHALVIEGLLDRAVPVFCEKPLTADVAEARRLVERGDGRIFVMDKWRYHPGVEAMASIAREGELGEVVGLRTARVGWKPEAIDVDVDVVWRLVPHDLAIAMEILGTIPAPRAAVAERDAGGVTGIVAILGTAPWLVVEVSDRRRKSFREVRLFCRHGIAVLTSGHADHIVVARRDSSGAMASLEQRKISTEPPLLRELRAFVAHLHGGPPPRSSVREAAAVVEAVASLRALAEIERSVP